MKILWIDSETTGLDCRVHEIIQLAGIIEINKQVIDFFNFRCRPSSPSAVDLEALKIQGRTLDEVMAWPDPKNLWDSFMGMIEPHIDKYDKKDKFIPAGQNVGFDIDFLAQTAKRHKENYLFSYLHYHKIDTMAMAMIAKLLGRLPTENIKLVTLARYFEIELGESAHDAMADIHAARQVAKKLLRLIAKNDEGKCCFNCAHQGNAGCPVTSAQPWNVYKNYCSSFEPKGTK